MAISVASSDAFHGSSAVGSSWQSEAYLPTEHHDSANQRDEDEDGSALKHSQGIWGVVYGATYLAQTPREQALSFKTGMASSLIQSTELMFVLLNTHAGLFAPDRKLWVYKYFSWVLLKLPLLEYTNQSYVVYITAVYILLATLLIVVGLFYWISSCIKNDEHERRKYKKHLGVLRPAAGLLFLVFSVAIMDLCATVFMCTWEDWPNPVPRLWPERGHCLEGTHLIHSIAAAGTFVLYTLVAIMMGVGTCEQNPASKHLSSSPNLTVRFQITAIIKPIYIIAATQLISSHKWQCVIALVVTLWACWMNINQVPYYRIRTGRLHCGLWLGCAYLACLGLVGATWLDKGGDEQTIKTLLTRWAGIGVLPAGIVGIIIGQLRPKLFERQLRQLVKAPVGVHSHKALHLKGRWHVEVLSRCVREGFDEKTGEFDQNSIDLAETVLSYGVAKYGKEDPFMVTLQASFSVFVYNNIQKARMQLQSVKRDHGNVLEAYGQYCCGEYIKAMKDSSEGDMDLTSYVEFAQHYRIATRAHRSALQAQRDFWRALLTDRVKYADLKRILDAIDKADQNGAQVYRRVMERYPNNAKLLRTYARFVEHVQHDPWRANKLYSKAECQDSSDNNMKLSGMIKAMKNSSSGTVDIDESKDGIVIINTAGVMMTTSAAFCSMFGYTRLEMEGRNVSMIIPPPYNQRHNGYIQQYLTTGESHVLDTTRRVIGIHKDKHMIPIVMQAQHLSGTGTDMVFLGILRPISLDPNVLEVWATPKTGLVLCVDIRFQDHYGFSGHEIAGKPLSWLLQDPTKLDTAVLQVSKATQVSRRTSDDAHHDATASLAAVIRHKYTDPVDVEITVQSVGTAAMPWLLFKLQFSRLPPPLAVFDQKLSIVSASNSFARLIGCHQQRLVGMNLSDIIPAPWSQLHSQWVNCMPAKPPRQSCRSGVCVNLLSKTNVQVPVKLSVTSKDDPEGGKHIVQVLETYKRERVGKLQHLLVSVDLASGCIIEVAHGSQPVFGWDPELVIGKPLAAVVDAFQMWEANKGPGSTTTLLQSLQNSANANPGESWRVGVQPSLATEAAVVDKDSIAGWGKVLKSIRGDRSQMLQPARLQVMLDVDEAESWDGRNRVNIALWRANAISGVLEVNHAMRIVKADELASIIMGHPNISIAKHNISRYFPDLPSASALLTSGPKGNLKKMGPSWGVGQPKTVIGIHRDGRPLTVSLQAVGMEGDASRQMTLHIRPVTDETACLEAFAQVEAQALANDDHSSDSDSSDELQTTALPKKFGNKRVSMASSSDAHEAEIEKHAPVTAPAPGTKLSYVHQQRSSAHMHNELPHGHRQATHSSAASAVPRSNLVDRQSLCVKKSADAYDEGSHDSSIGEEYEYNPDSVSLHNPPSHARAPATLAKHTYIDSPAPRRGQRELILQEDCIIGSSGGEGCVTASVSLVGKVGISSNKHSTTALDEGNVACKALEEGQGNGKRDGSNDNAGSIAASDRVGIGSNCDRSATVDLRSDARRAKRLKKLLNMLNSQTAQAPRSRFKRHTWLLLALIITARIACYVLFNNEVDRQHDYIYEVEEIARATDQASLMTAQGFTLAKCLLPQYASTVFFCEPSNLKDRVYGGLQKSVQYMRRGHHGIFMGFDRLRALDPPNLYSLWVDPVTTELTYYDTQPPVTIKANASLYMIGNAMINAGSQLASDAAPYIASKTQWADVFSSRHLQYILDQGKGGVYDGYTVSLDRLAKRAYDRLSSLYNELTTLMVLEAFIVMLGSVLYNWSLIHNMATQHMLAFMYFIAMPTALVRSMAVKPCLIDDEDETSAEDDGEFELLEKSAQLPGGKQVRVASPEGKGQHRQATSTTASRRLMADTDLPGARYTLAGLLGRLIGSWTTDAHTFRTNGKRLLPNMSMEMQSMSVFVVLQVLLVLIYAICFSRLSGLHAPLSQLNTAQHIVYRASRIRVFAVSLIFSTTPAEKQTWRANLARSCSQLEQEYNVMLYGGVVKSISKGVMSELQVYSPPVVFNDRATADLFFSTRECLRDDKTTCFKYGDIYYEVTHNGINTMMLRYLEECRLLQMDNDTDINPDNNRYHYIYTVGGKDLYEATQKLAYSITQNTIKAYDSVKDLQLVLLILNIMLPSLYLYFVFRPLLSRTRKHTSRVAGLLSQLPPEGDVEARLKGWLSRHRQQDKAVGRTE